MIGTGAKANLSGADLSGADLTGANLNGADLTGAYLADATWSNETIWPPEVRDAVRKESDETADGQYRIRQNYRVSGPQRTEEAT
jgi:hypothetical protein